MIIIRYLCELCYIFILNVLVKHLPFVVMFVSDSVFASDSVCKH